MIYFKKSNIFVNIFKISYNHKNNCFIKIVFFKFLLIQSLFINSNIFVNFLSNHTNNYFKFLLIQMFMYVHLSLQIFF